MKKTLVLLATVAFALVMLYSCNNGAKTEESESNSPFVKGQWTLNFFGEITTYQFNDDMSGKFISSKNEDSYDFKQESMRSTGLVLAGESICRMVTDENWQISLIKTL